MPQDPASQSQASDPSTFYITTPIYYVNDRPHIGHVYTTTVADVLARYHRLRGEDVFFLTGTDEHATKVVDAAQARGVSAQQWADTCAAAFKDTFEKLRFTHDDFIRTSEDRHKAKVREYVAALLKTGDVYLGEYEGWFDPGEEEYVPEARAKEYDYKSPISGRPLIRKTEHNFFFKLSAYKDQIIAAIHDGTFNVQPESRRNEILRRLEDAQDVPMSRTGIGSTEKGGWGIAMPDNDQTDEEHTVYVWVDALFNYLTTVDTPERRKYWIAGATHLIAKDILWFHAGIWPGILLALQKCNGYEWVRLPRCVYAHSFWISEGQKMSKSLGNFIDLEKIDDYIDRFGLDALRYFLAKNGPMGATDSDFAESAFVDTYNSDLANTFGNSFSRVANMTGKYFEGVVQEPIELNRRGAENTEQDKDIRVITSVHGAASSSVKCCSPAFASIDLSHAVFESTRLIQAVDTYVEHTAPFKLAKDPDKLPEVGTILYNCAEALRIASVLLWPVIPWKCEEVWRRMGLDYAEQIADPDQHGGPGRGDFEAWTRWGVEAGGLQPGTKIEKGNALFMRYQPPANG